MEMYEGELKKSKEKKIKKHLTNHTEFITRSILKQIIMSQYFLKS